MECAVYGASLSGYYATKLLKLQNHNIIFMIDKNEQNRHEGIDRDIPIYENIELVPQDLLSKIQVLVVATGEKEIADIIKRQLKVSFDRAIYTVHEEPYKEFYNLLSDRDKYQYLTKVGFYNSVLSKQSVDCDNKPIPWLSYPMVDFLKERICKDHFVFEWGSGNSTLWWEEHARKVVSVEHDKEWFEHVSNIIDSNTSEIIYKNLEYGGEYSKVILSFSNVDIVVVDGRDRVKCAINSIDSLSDTGIIIWDDTERPYYHKGIEYIKNMGFKMLTFKGLKGINGNYSSSSIFYRQNNCLNI